MLTYDAIGNPISYYNDISNPSGKKWGRTLDSMMLEWKVHNNFYYLTGHIRVAHTDFDYLDENTTRIDTFGVRLWKE